MLDQIPISKANATQKNAVEQAKVTFGHVERLCMPNFCPQVATVEVVKDPSTANMAKQSQDISKAKAASAEVPWLSFIYVFTSYSLRLKALIRVVRSLRASSHSSRLQFRKSFC